MKKKILLFDATVLTNAFSKTAGRSGIFFASYNICGELLGRPELEVMFYCPPKSAAYMGAVVEKCFARRGGVKIIHEDAGYFYLKKYYFRQKKYESREKGEKLKTVLYAVMSLAADAASKFCFSAKKELSPEQLDGVDIFFSPVFPAPGPVMRRGSIKKFTVLYDTLPLMYPEYFRGLDWYKSLVNSMNGTDGYFAISESTKRDFIKYVPAVSPKNITVIPLASNQEYKRITDAAVINAARGKYNIPAGKKYLLSMCTLEPRKNLIFAVKNFLEFIRKNNIDDMVFVLGGASWESFMGKLEQSLDGGLNAYKNKIIRAGYIDDADMNALYSGAEIFVYPSLYEGFGMPILEAMQCGAPVICSNTSSMPEVIGDAGIQINPEKGEELVAAFEKMYFDESFRQNCIKKGLERGGLFTWKKTADVIIDKINAEIM